MTGVVGKCDVERESVVELLSAGGDFSLNLGCVGGKRN